MNEHSHDNPYAGDEPGRGHDGNPYLQGRQPATPVDLDATAPMLAANEAQRLNRKALLFLAGIVGLVLLMALWVFRTASARDDKPPARVRQEKVVIPDLPEAPEGGQGSAATVPVQPIGVESYGDAAAPLPPLPEPAPVATDASNAYAGYDTGTASPAPPSLLERRMGLNATAGAGGDPNAAMAPGEGATPDAGPAGGGRSKATGARFLQNPDALLIRGTYLRCILETRIITDLPGFTSCVVTEPVYSINGRNLLLPKGSKVSGRYNTEPNGPRVAVVWDRITTPTGIDVNMASPGVDNLGGAGHPGHHDAHWPSRVATALMISLVSDAFKYAAAKNGPSTITVTDNYIVDTPYESNTARSVQRLADQALEQGARRPATVTINHGTMVNIYVARDVDFSGVLARR